MPSRHDQVVADQRRRRPAEEEEDRDRDHVEDRDPLVVGRQQPAAQRDAVGQIAGLAIAAGRSGSSVILRGQGMDVGDEPHQVVLGDHVGEGRHDRFDSWRRSAVSGYMIEFADVAIVGDHRAAVRQRHRAAVQARQRWRAHGAAAEVAAGAAVADEQGLALVRQCVARAVAWSASRHSPAPA